MVLLVSLSTRRGWECHFRGDSSMARVESHHSLCSCGSGKPYEKCCGCLEHCQVILFPRGKKNNYGVYLEEAFAELITYVKRYFYNWESIAVGKFLSYCQVRDLNERFIPLFWQWYVINYRFHSDVSPIIDFYIAENEDKIEFRYQPVYQALRKSYISIYQVQWIRNNAVSVKDIFCNSELIIEKDFGSLTEEIKDGVLFLARIITIDGYPMLLGEPIIMDTKEKNYLIEEFHSFRTFEGVDDPRVFLGEYADFIFGIVIDLNSGIRRNRIKSKSVKLAGFQCQWMINQLIHEKDFVFEENNDNWVKFKWKKSKLFAFLYIGNENVIAVSEDNINLDEMVCKLNQIIISSICISPFWLEGYPEKEADKIAVQILQDKYLQEWLNSPHLELEEMTPFEALKDVRGRVLLEEMLNDMETMELIVKSRGEYYFPTVLIRNKLNLNKKKRNRKLLHPIAVAEKVNKYRTSQELSPYVHDYLWTKEEYREVAIAAFDRYNKNPPDRAALAWILFIWNEFSSVYNPLICKPIIWLAAVEKIVLNIMDNKQVAALLSDKYKFSFSGIIIKTYAAIIARHLSKYPLDLSNKVVNYSRWDDLDYREKLHTYEEVQQHLQVFTYELESKWKYDYQEAHNKYYESINVQAKFWRGEVGEDFERFFQFHYILDFTNNDYSSIANNFWSDCASRYPSYLKNAAFNFMMSYVGAYKVIHIAPDIRIFEDIFTGERWESYSGIIYQRMQQGTIAITRLLPLGDKVLPCGPMYVMLPDLRPLFDNHLYVLLEKYNPYDISDFVYLKKRGEHIIKAYLLSMNELEQNAIDLMSQPLSIEWKLVELDSSRAAVPLLKANDKFRLLNDDAENSSFLWMNSRSARCCQWGYVLVMQNCLLITAPPGKDIHEFTVDVRSIFKNEDIIIAFRDFKASVKIMEKIEQKFIIDMACFFSKNPDLSMVLLRQDYLADEEDEWEQGIFMLKLGSRLIKYLQENSV